MIHLFTKHKMEKNSEYILKELEEHRKKDFHFSEGKILGSMCTNPHPIAKKAMIKFYDTNPGDPKLFTGTKEIEKKYIQFLKNLLNAPKDSSAIIGSGGTEGNITAVWLAKNISKKREIIVPESTHFSFKKIASLMDVKIITVPLNREYILDIDKLKRKINNKTAAVVGIAGSTELGTIDPISKISEICNDEHIFLHVDAAFGGYVIPFLKKMGYNISDYDFKIKGVSSISVDAHKMGCSVIPMGTLLVRKKEWLKNITVETPYISSKNQAGILGTRPGGSVASAYAVAKHLGFNGYKKILERCMNNTTYLEKKVKKLGLKLVVKPTMNVMGIKLKKPKLVAKKLFEAGWVVNRLDRLSAIRIVLMPHVTRKTIDDLLPIFEKICRQAKEI